MLEKNNFPPVEVELVHEGADGAIVLRATTPERRRFMTLREMLSYQVGVRPDAVFLKERSLDGWREVRYGEAAAIVTTLGHALALLGLSAERPLVILSGNSINHALLSLAAMSIGAPAAPISMAYSQFDDLSRLSTILETVTPGLVYADDGHAYRRALDVAAQFGYSTFVSTGAAAGELTLDALMSKGQSGVATAIRQEVGPQTIAKILFTSGSTGSPKGVAVTQEMMCSNQDAMAQVWPLLEDEPPVIVDWLPWNHIFGGSLVFNCVLRNGGTLVIDDGRPLPGQMQRSVEALRSHPPHFYLGVPKALNELVREFERDPSFEKVFFSRMKAMFSAGAALSEPTWHALRAACLRATGQELPLFIGWGATETAPVVSITRVDCNCQDSIGLPLPGAEILLVPNQDKQELRVRGPMVMPGYWRMPEATGKAFDSDGFYIIGDAGYLDPESWRRDGIRFDGRVAENFKLSNGTWVNAAQLRLAVLASTAPLFDECVVTGHDRDELGVLLFPNLAACRDATGMEQATLRDLVGHDVLHAAVTRAIDTLCANAGASTRVTRAIVLDCSPSIEAGEMTDKGYLNQRAALKRRANEVEALYTNPRPSHVIVGSARQAAERK
ncbi:AMP-binding protein [Cupriavidus consociatus]|uniref:AMP-binding protein n=1 Tax=Cupriavidus consociatus TaxID=2821357 RepID=UPI001AE83CC7|nr:MULTISPECIES: AMP-binding protein [unclassified Cupriavidus]MBP0623764.1 AMP-binding protein [Cupriavidus sp. LEh25]MDK2660470.1 AMP-binding protein [Cupriavidus sp. LEh21]